MSDPTPHPDDPHTRYVGRVTRVGPEYGFIASEDVAQDAYFRPSWVRGERSLHEGDVVTFELRVYEDGVQARHIEVTGGSTTGGTSDTSLLSAAPPITERLLQWAYMGYLPTTLSQLATLALPERWEFKNTVADPARPYPILHSYVLQTFGRLVLEEKVSVNPDYKVAAFNTGLVDRRYEPIYGLFVQNSEPRVPWRLASFCTAGEGSDGQQLVRYFNPLPPLAHYFDEPSDLLYDTRVGKPEMDWRHVVIDRIDRYPAEFIEDHWPPGHPARDTSTMSREERRSYWQGVGAAIESDNRIYRSIMNRVRDAVELSVKRVGWNFKTAVPQYYAKVRRLQLLLPISLVSDDQADMALAVERTPSGSYLGHTVLALDWAYKNARLICRPDSDWLAASDINEVDVPDDDSDHV